MNKLHIQPNYLLTLSEILVSLNFCKDEFDISVAEKSHAVSDLILYEFGTGEILWDKHNSSQCYYYNSNGNFIFSLENGLESITKLGDLTNFSRAYRSISKQQAELCRAIKTISLTEYSNKLTDYNILHTEEVSNLSDLVINQCIDLSDKILFINEQKEDNSLTSISQIIGKLFTNNKPCSPAVLYENTTDSQSYYLYDYLLWSNKNHSFGLQFLLQDRASDRLLNDLIALNVDLNNSRPLPTLDNDPNKKSFINDSVINTILERNIDLVNLIEKCRGSALDSVLNLFMETPFFENYLSQRICKTLSESICEIRYSDAPKPTNEPQLDIFIL